MVHSSWRLAVLVALVVASLVVAITIALLVGDGGSDNDNGTVKAKLGEALAVDADPLVVTGVRVVEGSTDDDARNKCSALPANAPTAEWIIAGRNLNATTVVTSKPTGTAAYTFLCMRQEQTSMLAAAANANVSTVLHSVRVLNEAACPPALTLLFSPRANISICAQTIDAKVAIATGMYVSDVTVTAEKTFFSSVPGWVTEGTNVALAGAFASTTNPLYLSYKRPVRPIAAVRALHGVGATNASTACSSQLGVTWEQAGYGAVNNVSAASTNRREAILCVERVRLNATQVADPLLALTSMLVDIAFVLTTSSCSDGFTDRQELTSEWTLCSKFASSSTSASYIGELRLQELRTKAGLAKVLEKAAVVPNFRVHTVASGDTNAPVIAVYRQHTGIVVVETATAASVSANTSLAVLSATANPAKPPIRARVVPSILTSSSSSGGNLRSNSNANSTTGLAFKVLQLADLHYTGDPTRECRNPPQDMIDAGRICTEADTTAFVERVLDAEAPDFVVFSGDNVEVPSGGSMAAAIASLVGPVEARKIPYAVVFGNHDDENGQSREVMASMLIGREYSYMQWGPPSIHGVGNYEVSVAAPSDGAWGQAGDSVFRMYLLDSLAYPSSREYPGVKSSYDWVKPDQIEYYKEMALANRPNASNTTGAVPAVMFFHIPIPEYASVGSASHRNGGKNEAVMASEINSNLFQALVEMGDVKATFVGHDHVNDYCFKRHGIQLCYGGGAGFAHAYGSASFARRSRVIEWGVDAANRRRMRSWKRHYGSEFATPQLEEVLYEES